MILAAILMASVANSLSDWLRSQAVTTTTETDAEMVDRWIRECSEVGGCTDNWAWESARQARKQCSAMGNVGPACVNGFAGDH
ncbi:MAG: hypothetical protein ACRDGM_09940 [bacterium]